MGAVSTEEQSLSAFAPGGRVGLHGMLVFGAPGAEFISHIPMFHAPHDVQAVFRVTVSPNVPGLAETLHTLKPETMSLDDVVLEARTSFAATLFRGNFESGGTPVANVQVTVEGRVFAQVLTHAASSRPNATEHPFIVVGTREAAFALPRIDAAPGYDQLLRLRFTDEVPPAAMLARGFLARFPGAREGVATRFLPGDISLFTVPRLEATFQVEVEREFSVLVGPDFVQAP